MQTNAKSAALAASLAAIASLALLDSGYAQQSGSAADEAAIKAVIKAFIDTREANDSPGLTALLSSFVDQQPFLANVRRGREAVVSGSLSTQQSTGGKRTITVDSVRFMSSDVALADGRYDSVGRADGSDRHMLTSMVLRREAGAWKIAAIRNMLPTQPER